MTSPPQLPALRTFAAGDVSTERAPQLSDDARFFASASLSRNTVATYKAAVRGWETYAASAGLPSYPANEVDVANWIAARAMAGKRIASLRLAVSAIGTIQRLRGGIFNSQHPEILRVLKGVDVHDLRQPRQAAPLKADILGAILDRPPATVADKRDRALIALLYAFGMRSAELAGLDWYSIGRGTSVLSDAGDELLLHRIRTKTVKTGVGIKASISAAANGKSVEAVRAWVEAAKLRPGEPVCRRITKSGRITPTRFLPRHLTLIVRRHVLAVLTERGIFDAAEATRLFSSHSGRRGIITTSLESGVEIDRVATHVGHSTIETTRRYASAADARRNDPTTKKGVGV